MNIQFFHESASKKNPTRLAHGALCHVIGSALHALGRVRLLVGQDTARLQQVLSAHSQDTRSAVALLRLAANLLEVDTSYHAIPAVTTAQHWEERTPEGVVFNVKSFSLFTRQWPTHGGHALLRQRGRNAVAYAQPSKTAADRFDYDYTSAELLGRAQRFSPIARSVQKWELLLFAVHASASSCKSLRDPSIRAAIESRTMLQSGSIFAQSIIVNRLFSWPRRVRLATPLVLALASVGPNLSWARSPQFDSAALLTPQPSSFAQCPQFFANGVPPAITPRPQLRELCYEAFAVLHSGTTRTPVFVAQRLNRQSVEDADEKRAKRFFTDARLPSGERAELEDYKSSGYSRGHMAPAGDMPTPTAMAQSFSLANMVPQNPQQNGGA